MPDLVTNLEKFLDELTELLNKSLITKEIFDEEKTKAVNSYLRQMREKYDFKDNFEELLKGIKYPKIPNVPYPNRFDSFDPNRYDPNRYDPNRYDPNRYDLNRFDPFKPSFPTIPDFYIWF